jgi:hypothetical protein
MRGARYAEGRAALQSELEFSGRNLFEVAAIIGNARRGRKVGTSRSPGRAERYSIEPCLPQAPEHVEASEAGSHDDGV